MNLLQRVINYKVFFVQYIQPPHSHIYPTIVGEIVNSLAQLASIFKGEGYAVHAQINSFKKQLTSDDFLEKAREVRPDIVAISTLTFEILNTYKLIKMFKDEGYMVMTCPS
jgi:phosphosulfolactate synthase (CoM biosynthesis protein A)